MIESIARSGAGKNKDRVSVMVALMWFGTSSVLSLQDSAALQQWRDSSQNQPDITEVSCNDPRSVLPLELYCP